MVRDRKSWMTALAVAAVFAFALFIRAYWNLEAATPDATFVLSESDAYFEHHTAERIQTEGWSHPIKEPLVNYPIGGINPNPPLWEWWIATWGALLTPLFAGDAANHAVACPADAAPSQATCVSTWWVTLFSPALFGALTVLVVVLIGREVWGWSAGFFAGFLLATSTAHIERSVLGFADHDAMQMFFIMLTVLFFTKALHAAREGRWVGRWGSVASVTEGLRSYGRSNQVSLAYALMAGLGMAGVGLVWKGFSYVAGIILVYGLVQLLLNHWRQRDNTHIFGVVTLTLLVGVLVALPYYANPGLSAVFDTVVPLAFMLLGWLLLGFLFTASRDLPFVLVLPAIIAAGLVALVAAFFLMPSVAATLLAPLVYFKQTKLYTTIAEAHPADFNTVVFGMGVVGYFLALLAIPYALWLNRKRWAPAPLFLTLATAIAIFMMQSAVRFMVNAAPFIALMAGWTVALLVGRLRFDDVSKNVSAFTASGSERAAVVLFLVADYVLFAAAVVGALMLFGSGWTLGLVLLAVAIAYYALRWRVSGNVPEALRRSNGPFHIVGGVLIALMLVLPNLVLAVDAGMPSQYEEKLIREELAAKGQPYNDANRAGTFTAQRLGAFGQGFISDYWRVLFEWLQKQDTDKPSAERPGFLSWWDYGHWALSLGHHPAVADNFQNGFVFAGNFIVAQNETHQVQLLIARIAEGETGPSVAVEALQGAGLSEADARATYDTIRTYEYAPQLPLDQAVKALAALEARTGDRIRYFAMDIRLFPYDNPDTPSIDFGSIFYAPVTLSDHNPDDYVEVKIKATFSGGGTQEFNQTTWIDFQKSLTNAQNVQQATELYDYKPAFFNTSFYKAYIGTPVGLGSLPATDCDTGPGLTSSVKGDRLPGIHMPGFCMEHWRLVYFDPSVRMLRYYPGAVLQGSVEVDGKPLQGARVVVYDDAGDMLFPEAESRLTDQFKEAFAREHGRNISARDLDVPHDVATTDANGTWSLVAPFATTGKVTVRAFRDEAELGSAAFDISQADAEGGRVFDAALGAIHASSGSVAGKVFFDADRNRLLTPGDAPLGGAAVTLDGDPALRVTTGPDGAFVLGNVTPGRHAVGVAVADHELAEEFVPEVLVKPAKQEALDVPMWLRKAAVNGTVWRDANGDGKLDPDEGVPGARINSLADFRVEGNTAVPEGPQFSGVNGSWPATYQLTPGAYVLRGDWVNTTDGRSFAWGALQDIPRGQAELTVPLEGTQLLPATVVSVNVTRESEPGNVTSAPGAEVLFIPTGEGVPGAERAPVNGTLTIRLPAGTYEVWGRATADAVYSASRVPLVVGTQPVNLDLRLTKEP